MIIKTEKAAEKLNPKLSKLLFDKEKQSELIDAAEKFQMPSGEIMDYIAGRRLLEQADPFRLFIISTCLDSVNGTETTKRIFTPTEIKEFSKQKLEVDKITFPMNIHCIQVAEDQWIGATDMKFLMRLYNSQLIKYNENTQRVMQKVVRKNNVYYKISVNQKAVSAIADSIKRGSFISNTITLKLPEEAEWSYDKESSVLTIKKIDMFDIADGYHRLLAMSRVYSEDKDIDLPLELRIITFDEEKTRQFIYQEDQKTKMRRVDSDSMNLYDPCNRIVEKLNIDPSFSGQNLIGRNEGNINYGELSKVIRHYFPSKKFGTKREEVQYINKTEKQVREMLNTFLDNHPEYLETTVPLQVLVAIFHCEANGSDINKILPTVSEVRNAYTIKAIDSEIAKLGKEVSYV